MKTSAGTGRAIECVKKCRETGELAPCFIDCYLGPRIVEAYVWLDYFRKIVEDVRRLYGFVSVTYSREFKSFVIDPRRHLEKKLFIYTHDYRRNRIGLEEYATKAMMAINTSLRTNMRTLYQNWCFLALLYKMYSEGTRVVYPEHRVLELERSGKQKLRWIPPNIILDFPRYGSLSFYIEAPRPLAWGDSKDLENIWGLYTALRPDMMIYGGRVYDIVEPGSSPPIKRPDLIIEFKELPDWYRRVRDVKGPLARPLSAEEWRNRWIEGLWDGLADVLGVSRREAMEKARSARGVRLDEVRVVQLYRSVYNPKKTILVSKHIVPDEVREKLASHDIEIVDNVGFSPDRLGPLAKTIMEYAVPVEEYVIKTRDRELAEVLLLVKELWEKGILDREKVRKLLILGLEEGD